jgi:hypothetical protein
MNKIVLLFALFVGIIFSFQNVYAGKFQFRKVSRDIKKEAHKYEKEGWKVEPGNMPIKNQLENSFSKQNEVTEEGFPKWITANGSSVAQTQSAAEMQAVELAKNRLVGLIETHMKDVITSDVANNQMDSKDAASLTKTIETSTNTVCKKLGRVLPLFKVYRTVGNNTEVQVLLAYNYSMVLKDIIDQMKTDLQNTATDQRQKFDKLLNSDAYKTGEIVNSNDSN